MMRAGFRCIWCPLPNNTWRHLGPTARVQILQFDTTGHDISVRKVHAQLQFFHELCPWEEKTRTCLVTDRRACSPLCLLHFLGIPIDAARRVLPGGDATTRQLIPGACGYKYGCDDDLPRVVHLLVL